MAANSNGNIGNHQTLHIDNVVSSQPELGPTPPDGGYGWIILLGAIVTQVTIPSIFASYGVLILFLNLQEDYEDNEKFHLWDKTIVLVPILITVFWLLFEPWSRTVVLLLNRPRVVSISGVLLISAGLMLSNYSAESDENDVVINVFSGIIIGMGASLTTQQSDILLKHYFRKKLEMIQIIYKTSAAIGNILVTVLMGTLCIRYDISMSLIIYAAIILQNCITLAAYSRPVYITKRLQQNYKVLHEEEDDDEEIYSSRVQVQMNHVNGASGSYQNTDREENAEATIEDNDDENVIGTFNTGNTSREIVLPSPNLVRLESNRNPFGSNFIEQMDRIEQFEEQPQALYRETTVVNDTPASAFAFEVPPPTSGTIRRTANTQKNIAILFAILKDRKFYAYTYLMLSIKYSIMIFGVIYPPYISQQIPHMDIWNVAVMVTITYIGALCLNIVMGFFSFAVDKRMVIRFLGIIAVLGFLGLSTSRTRSWLMLWGVLTSFSTTGLYVAQQPIYNTMMMEFDASVISIASNLIVAVHILAIMFIHNYEYGFCFELAGFLQLLVPIVSFFL